MSEAASPQPPKINPPPSRRGKGCLFYGSLAGLILVVVITTTALVTAWWIKRQIQAEPIPTTELTPQEQDALESKLQAFRESGLEPVVLTEKEINAMISQQPEFSGQADVTLKKDVINARYNYLFEEDVPFFGGKTLQIRANLKVVHKNDRLTVQIKKVYLGPISIPNAWMGGLKNIDLVEEFMAEDPGFKQFVEGIEHLSIEDGRLVFVPSE